MGTENFNWTARLDAHYPEGITVFPDYFIDLSDQLLHRAPVFAMKKGAPIVGISLAANGETAESAGEEARTAVQEGFNVLGMTWMDVEVISVVSNSSLNEDIARIDSNTGIMRPEAEVIRLFEDS